MKTFLKGATLGLIVMLAVEARAQCFWSDVTGTFDAECNITSVKKAGKEATGATRERILDKFEQMLREKNGDCGAGGSFGNCNVEEGGADGGRAGQIQEKIEEIMLVSDEEKPEDKDKKYLNNINSVRENQNKMKLNAVTRSIAVGRRAVALALKSGEDIDELRAEIEQSKDMLNLLKSITKLQAQHLQKINQTTALRSRLLELNAIDIIIAGDIQKLEKKSPDEDAKQDGAETDNDEQK